MVAETLDSGDLRHVSKSTGTLFQTYFCPSLDDRGWDGWMESPTQWIWAWACSWSSLKLMPFELVIPSNHLILCHPLFLPSIFPSIRVFSNELALPIRWPKYWSFSFSISPFNEYSELISFRIDWFDLLAVPGTFKSSPTWDNLCEATSTKPGT